MKRDPREVIAEMLGKHSGASKLVDIATELSGLTVDEYVQVINVLLGMKRESNIALAQDAFIAGALLAKRRMTQ